MVKKKEAKPKSLSNKEYYEKNKEEHKQRCTAYKKLNKDKVCYSKAKRSMKDYLKKHPDVCEQQYIQERLEKYEQLYNAFLRLEEEYE